MSQPSLCKYQSLISCLHYFLCCTVLLLDTVVKEMKDYMFYDLKYCQQRPYEFKSHRVSDNSLLLRE